MKITQNKFFLLREFVSDTKFIQGFFGFSAILLGGIFYFFDRTAAISMRCIFWTGRVVDIKILEQLSVFIIRNFFLKTEKNCKETILHRICFQSDFFDKSLSVYTIDNQLNKVSIFRDLIVLKKKQGQEKGVVLIKYTPAFDSFYYYFDFDLMARDYYFVLEPSWAGACDPSFLLYWRNSCNKNVIVQAIEPKDYEFISKLRGNFVPIDLGSSDWTDVDMFSYKPDKAKEYDLVMVSNWGIHKKHKELFKALEKVEKKLSVLLIGFPWRGRTKEDVLRESEQFNLSCIELIIKENVSPLEVSEFLNRSKVFVLLSKKEGGNKAIMEAFFSNVPAILYKDFVGGVQMMVNNETGILSSYEDLSKNIEFMVENFRRFSPRKWIQEHSGSKVSTQRLNSLLKQVAFQQNECWSRDIAEKVNVPNLKYKNEYDAIFHSDIFYQYKR